MPASEGPGKIDRPIQYLKGVGQNLALLYAKVGVETVRDLLYFMPRRYEDRTNLPPMSQIRPGQWVSIRGQVIGVDSRAIGRGRVVVRCMVSDGRHSVALVWFNQPWVKRKLERYGGEIIAYGQVKEGGSFFEIHSPEYELLDEDQGAEAFAKIVPVYSLTEGLMQGNVRRAVSAALLEVDSVEEAIPSKVRARHQLLGIHEALREIHRPTSDPDRQEARRRLVFEEFLGLQLALAMKRDEVHHELGPAFDLDLNDDGSGAEALWEEVGRMLPFQLTGDQHRAVIEIWRDMQRPFPMNRLLQGDVGSGKTAVAACAMLAAVRGGRQAALMAPTEILAEQHAANLTRLFEPLGIDVVLLVGKMGAQAKAKAKKRAAHDEPLIAIGTHALIQEGLEFANLGLAVIDEQHRFGVLQRAALREKGMNPEVLVMTATPIPRTLTMTLYGDLDLSQIKELPPGRRPIKTHWKRLVERDSVYEAIADVVRTGQQAYVVCPLIADSEKMQAQAASELYERLRNGQFGEFTVGLLHGQLPSKEREEVMEQFRSGAIQVLVATTVIEVGVDVPNATAMIIEDANRFGLSQLHQLRGRIGRGSQQSYCVLIADPKNEEAKKRMEIMADTTDGFKIAEMDLVLRGPGEMAGTRQHGFADFRIADLIQDASLLEEARELAIRLVQYDPGLKHSQHALLRADAMKWKERQAAAAVS